MVSINLYKLDNEKKKQCINEFQNRLEQKARLFVKNTQLTLYASTNLEKKPISWNWVLEEFNQESVQLYSSPKAVILIEKSNGISYVVAFGHSYFLVDKYCDRDFGFSLARKIEFGEIRTTTLSNPNTIRKKTINTYSQYNSFEFDSGESFFKIKAKMKQSDGFSLFKPTLEMGTSVKVTTDISNLENILDIIIFIENVLENEPDINRIPVFSKIRNDDQIEYLEDQLIESLQDELSSINISELEIIGTNEVFNNIDNEYCISYNKYSKKIISSLTNEEIKQFCIENNLDFPLVYLDILISFFRNGEQVFSKKMRSLIEYSAEDSNCLLLNGIWYEYNDDYLEYLNESISEIKTCYDRRYDFPQSIHESFIQKKYSEEKSNQNFDGESKEIVLKN